MSGNFKKIFQKNTLLIVVVVLLASYVIWDISTRVLNSFWVQGYAQAVNEIILHAKEDCEPFFIYSDEGEVQLINIDCLMELEEEL